MRFGVKIREIRESQGLLQRQLAASLEIDTPMLSKIERGDRKAKREQVEHLAILLDTNQSELLRIWLADQIVEILKDEPQAIDVLKTAIKEISK